MQAKNQKKYKYFGMRLKALRVSRGVTQRQLALDIGKNTQVQVSRIEQGKSWPKEDVFLKIAETLDADLHWLITGEASLAQKNLMGIFFEALGRFAPYVGDAITRLFEKKAELIEKRKALSVRRLEDKEEQAVRLELLDKDIAKVQEYINQTVKDLGYIQDPFGDGSSAQAAIKDLEKT